VAALKIPAHSASKWIFPLLACAACWYCRKFPPAARLSKHYKLLAGKLLAVAELGRLQQLIAISDFQNITATSLSW